ncbi:SigE family RNA polymerase sigma factor [Serinicoccus sp. LYQ131]|uniref:SigE family RNA polymerase sigma factor n=1 Tax=Serinicoccus sp. LYQ131 TaxID=3378797 RepID=UPI003852E42D
MRPVEVDEDFAAFVGAHQDKLQRAAFLLCGEREQARDLAQEALTRTAQHWSRVRHEMPLAYARRILYTAHVDQWRKTGPEVLTDGLPERSVGDDGSWAQSLTIRRALQQLPPRVRVVVVLRYFEDLDVATTARTLGIAQGTVKSQTSDGIRRLRELLSEVGTDA